MVKTVPIVKKATKQEKFVYTITIPIKLFNQLKWESGQLLQPYVNANGELVYKNTGKVKEIKPKEVKVKK